MSIHERSRALYSSFNARALSPLDVARTFVPPACFLQLANQCHTFVIGPRGSGKTTLFKMLETPAVETWQHDDAGELRSQLEFTGVYIPTDVTFASQLSLVASKFSNGDALLRSAYAIHVMRSLLQAFEYCAGRVSYGDASLKPHIRFEVTSQQEQEFVLEFANALGRKIRIPTFGSMKVCLSRWLMDVYAYVIDQATASSDSEKLELSDSELSSLTIAGSATLAVECFESCINVNHTRWGLMFDELELAPDVVVRELTRLVRSTDQRLLFKLSLSPYVSSPNSTDTFVPELHHGQNVGDLIPPAQEHEDYETIRLWTPYKRTGEDFCRNLANSVIETHGFRGETLETILGGSVFDEPEAAVVRKGGAYKPGSAHNKRMKRLASKDLSFQEYLDRKQIDLNKSIRQDDMRAKTLRKVQGIVIVRDEFRSATGGKRSRKSPDIYSGARVFMAVSESNPRLIIGLLNQLLSTVRPEESNCRIHPHKQAAVFSSATDRFMAYLRTIPSRVHSRGLLPLIKGIGEYFFDDVVLSDFIDDPHTSFTVDSRTPRELEEAIQSAVNAGAIIWVPDADDLSLLTSVKGKRFRLTYLLATRFHLPIQLGRSLSLGRILDQETPSDDYGLPGFEENP